jgi:hypothetical protein
MLLRLFVNMNVIFGSIMVCFVGGAIFLFLDAIFFIVCGLVVLILVVAYTSLMWEVGFFLEFDVGPLG